MVLAPPKTVKTFFIDLCIFLVNFYQRLKRTEHTKNASEALHLYQEKNSCYYQARTWKQPRGPSADEWIRKQWYIYTMEYYSAIKKNTFESILIRWMKLDLIIQSEVSQKEKHQYSILTHIYGI